MNIGFRYQNLKRIEKMIWPIPLKKQRWQQISGEALGILSIAHTEHIVQLLLLYPGTLITPLCDQSS
jgi:hypothetical protein